MKTINLKKITITGAALLGLGTAAITATNLATEPNVVQAASSKIKISQNSAVKKFKAKYPDHVVISYINCSAEIKTLSDIICTSGNALQIVKSLPENQKIIFAPDKNLGGYVNRMTGRNMILWNGSCEVHELLTVEHTIKMKMENPDAVLIAHPECNNAVLEISDFVGSTQAMIKYVKKLKRR